MAKLFSKAADPFYITQHYSSYIAINRKYLWSPVMLWRNVPIYPKAPRTLNVICFFLNYGHPSGHELISLWF